jgi:SNF2 family DNA or RNA helicase
VLVLKDKKALVFKLRDPKKITTVIPTAKIVINKGEKLVAVPHRPDEVRVLRNLGFEVPDPMPLYYGWPGRFQPFQAQIETANFMAMHDRMFCLNSMGLGKTVTSLWGYDYLKSCKQVQKVLVVCPLSTMERTWADAAFNAFPHLDVAVLYGSREKRLKLLKQDVDVYIVNADGIKIIKDALAKRPDINLIIVDEIAMFRNAATERWKTLNEICNKQTQRKVWGLTGMPTPNLPTDAWAQCRIICPENPDVPKYFSRFRDMVMRQVSQFKWEPKPDALDTVKKCMQPAIRFALDDCTDLPEQIFSTRDVELTTEQRDAYNAMVKKLRAEYAGGQILAVNEAVKANKLIQIACGVAYGSSGENVVIPAKPRLDVLKEIIEESEGKVIVFVPLTGALEHVVKEVQAAGWTVAAVHGETPKNQRDDIFSNFQKTSDPHVLVANPGTMSHGLTLTAATTIVWFAPIHSNDIYQQANARVRRPGQTRTTVIVNIAACEIERKIYARLKAKQTVQGILLDMMGEVVEK